MKGPGTIVNKVKAMAIWRKDGQETDVAHNRQKKEEERCLVVPPSILSVLEAKSMTGNHTALDERVNKFSHSHHRKII